MAQAPDVVKRHDTLAFELAQAVDDGQRGVVGGGRNLEDRCLGGQGVEDVEIGERAADIDADDLHGVVVNMRMLQVYLENI